MDEILAGNAEDNRRMKTVVFRPLFFLVIGALLLLASAINARAKADSKEVNPELAAQEKEGCAKNLKAIYAAIEAYRLDHKDVPNWFSDLVPDCLPDVNVLDQPCAERGIGEHRRRFHYVAACSVSVGNHRGVNLCAPCL